MNRARHHAAYRLREAHSDEYERMCDADPRHQNKGYRGVVRARMLRCLVLRYRPEYLGYLARERQQAQEAESVRAGFSKDDPMLEWL